MQNLKCSSRNHVCPEELDICCQFCRMNYSPCDGKCSGCWDAEQPVELSFISKDPVLHAKTELAAPCA